MTAFSWQWFELTLDAAVKSVFLATLVAVAIPLFKIRNSHVRHRLWVGVLAAMLTLPLLSPIVPQLRLPISVPQRWLSAADEDTPVPDNAQRIASENSPSTVANPDLRSPRHRQDSDRPPPFEMQDEQVLPSSTDALSVDHRTASDSISQIASAPTKFHGASATVMKPARAVPSSGTRILRQGPFWLAVVWLAGAAIMLLRLMCGLFAAWRLKRVSTPISIGDLQDLGVSESCWPSDVRSVLLECPLIRVPLTLGVIRPVVLLPAEWLEWSTEKLEAVLLHERMHVERRDSAIAFVSEFNVTVNWLNPLSWWLRQRLSLLAEEACDDAAIVSTGDRTTYARHLLEVAAAASASRGRVLPATVSMARRSNVESRINAILDFTRPLSQRPTWTTTLLILLLSGPIIALAAALAPGRTSIRSNAPEQGPNTTVAAAADAVPDKDTAQTQPPNEQKAEVKPVQKPEAASLSLRGRVLDPAGKPVADATVMIRRTVFGQGESRTETVREVARMKSSANGDFEYTFAANEFRKPGGRNRMPDVVYVIAMKPGYGMAINEAWNWMEPRPLDVSLTGIEPIRGKLLDAEGRPVVGAEVRLIDVYHSTTSDVDKWLERIREGSKGQGKGGKMAMPVMALRGDYPPGSAHQAPIAEDLLSTKSAADGTFELLGIGRDHRIVLQITATQLAASVLDVITRPMPSVRMAPQFGTDPNRVFNGSEFTYVMETGFGVTGRLTDADSGQPIVGAEVTGRLDIMWDNRRGQLETKTDADGRYHLEGLAWSGDNGLGVAMPNLPYLGTSFVRVRRPSGNSPANVDLKFKRIVWAGGQVTDVQMGKPVIGSIFYSPFANNEFVKLHPSYSTGSVKMLSHYPSGRTSAEGRFRIPVIQGRGIICFMADEDGYSPEAGRDKIPEFADPLKTPQVTIDHGIPTLFHAVSEVNPAADATEVTVDLQPDSGRSITLHLVDPRGKPISGTHVNGLSQTHRREHVAGSDAILKHARIGEARRLEFVNENTGDRATIVFRPTEGQTESTVQLQLPGRIAGRLVDPDGQPIANVSISSTYKSTGDFTSSLGRNPVTDQDGRFSQEVTAGEKYTVRVDRARTRRYDITLRSDLVTEPGETIDIGDFEVDLNSKANDAKSLGSEKRSKEPWRKATTATTTKTDGPAAGASIGKAAQAQSVSDGKAESAPLKKPEDGPLTLRGRVIDPKGQTVAGASVMIRRAGIGEDMILQDAVRTVAHLTSGANGEFEHTFAANEFNQPGYRGVLRERDVIHVIASKPGFGLAINSTWKWPDPKPLDVSLTLNEPIRGRLLDAEGRPVAALKVQVIDIYGSTTEQVDKWLGRVKQGSPGPETDSMPAPQKANRGSSFPPAGLHIGAITENVFSIKTGADGTFELLGVGRDQRAVLLMTADKLAATGVNVIARPMDPVRLPKQTFPDKATPVFYGSVFSSVMEAGFSATGRLTDFDSGHPIAGATIISSLSIPGDKQRELLETRTDADGRYKIDGFALSRDNRLQIAMPNLPYLGTTHLSIPRPTPNSPAILDFKFKRTVWASGQVTDVQTGRPVIGTLFYTPFTKNEFTNQHPRYSTGATGLLAFYPSGRTDAKGQFRFPIIQGKGVVCFLADDPSFAPDVGREAIPEFAGSSNSAEATIDHIGVMHALAAVNPAADAAEVTVNVQADSGRSIILHLVDEQGHPVDGHGTTATGVRMPFQAEEITGSDAVLKGARAGQSRALKFINNTSGDRISVVFRPAEGQTEATITLLRPGRIIGRLVDPDGHPVAGANVAMPQITDGDSRTYWSPYAYTVTDKEGRFSNEVTARDTYDVEVTRFRQRQISLRTNLKTEPGETVDIGDFEVELASDQIKGKALGTETRRREPWRKVTTGAKT